RAIGLGLLQELDLAPRLALAVSAERVVAHLDDPELAVGPPGEVDGGHDDRLGGHQLDLEAGGGFHAGAGNGRRIGARVPEGILGVNGRGEGYKYREREKSAHGNLRNRGWVDGSVFGGRGKGKVSAGFTAKRLRLIIPSELLTASLARRLAGDVPAGESGI